MIYDKLENAGQYTASLQALSKAVEYARSIDLSMPDGRIEIEGENTYGLLSSYETMPESEVPFEAHRKHVDIQFVLEGRERLDVSHDDDLEVKEPYSEEGDAALYNAPDSFSSVILEPGKFVVLLPQDKHRPACQLGGAQRVRKLVVKARI